MSLPVGSRLRFRAKFSKDGRAFPAATVTVTVITPSAKMVTLTESSGITKDMTGSYSFEMVCDRRGVYEVTWSSVAFKEEAQETQRYAVGVADEEATIKLPPAGPTVKPASQSLGIPIAPYLAPEQVETIRADRAAAATVTAPKLRGPSRGGMHPSRTVAPTTIDAPPAAHSDSARDIMVVQLKKAGVAVHPSRDLAWVNREYKKIMGSRRAK